MKIENGSNYNVQKAFVRGLMSPYEYAENIARNNRSGRKIKTKTDYYKFKEEVEKMLKQAEKQAEVIHHFNGENILTVFEEVKEGGAENHEEALQMIIEGNLLYDSIPYHHQRRELLKIYGYEYVLYIIEEEFGAEIWNHVSPNDSGALVDLATEAEARTFSEIFFELAH